MIKIIGVIAVVALILSGFTTYRLMPKGQDLGAAGGLLIENYVPAILYNDGYKSEREIVLSGANGDLTVGGGLLTVTTSNTATSSTSLGCVQTTATSTASPVRLVFSSISTSSPTFTGTNTIGLVGWQFGACPI